MSNILIVPTALRPPANSTRVANVLETQLAEAGTAVTMFDLRSVPLFGTVERDDSPEILAFREAVSSADAVVWVVPTYHNDMPGSAKNALDHLEITLMNGRLNTVVGVASGPAFTGAARFSATLRFIGGRLPLNDVYVGDIRNKWPAGEETPPQKLVDQMNAFAEQLTEAIAAAKA